MNKEITTKNGYRLEADFEEKEIYVYLKNEESYKNDGSLQREAKVDELFLDDDFIKLHDEVFGDNEISKEMDSWNDEEIQTYLTVRQAV